jgi:SAM-dependent methyltransferase
MPKLPSTPWLASEAPTSAKRHAPATARNRDPIARVLYEELPESGLVLEIASGSGEHVVHFAQELARLVFQPSDPDEEARASIRAWTEETGVRNVREPLALDVEAAAWPIARADAVLCINMVHISPWSATLGLLDGAARVLSGAGALFLYGPYRRDGVVTAESNEAFDRSLRERNPSWGLRRLEDLDREASARGFVRTRLVEMPANNLSLVYRREAVR